MSFVYFQILRADGTTEPRLLPSEQIGEVRPLTKHESEFAKDLGQGRYKEFGKAAADAPFLEDTGAKEEDIRDYKLAKLYDAIVPHPDVKSVLVSTDKTKYFLAHTVNELASTLPDLVPLTRAPKNLAHRRWKPAPRPS